MSTRPFPGFSVFRFFGFPDCKNRKTVKAVGLGRHVATPTAKTGPFLVRSRPLPCPSVSAHRVAHPATVVSRYLLSACVILSPFLRLNPALVNIVIKRSLCIRSVGHFEANRRRRTQGRATVGIAGLLSWTICRANKENICSLSIQWISLILSTRQTT